MDDLKAAIDAINPNSTDEEWTKLLAEAMNAAARIEALEGALADCLGELDKTERRSAKRVMSARAILLREQG